MDKLERFQFSVEGNLQNQRLDTFLTFSTNKTRTSIKKSINEGLVKVNGVIEYRPHYKVKDLDLIDLEYHLDESPQKVEAEEMNLEIVYEDKDLLVINKPAGMVVHPATKNWNNTVVNKVLGYFKQLNITTDNNRANLIHRLDKATSGLLLIGKTSKGLWYYTKLFAERQIEKSYLAIVKGDLRRVLKEKNYLEVQSYIGRNPGNRLKMTQVEPASGKLAISKIYPIDARKLINQLISLVRVEPKTGRMHQIRVHLLQLGFPILGDNLYGRNNQYKRLMLHAWKLKLELLNGKNITLVAPIPEEFHELFKQI